MGAFFGAYPSSEFQHVLSQMTLRHTLVLNCAATPFSVMPPSALTWHRAICCVLLGHLKPVHFYDNWVIHSQSASFRVPAVAISTKRYIHIDRKVSHRYSNAFLRDNFTCQYCGIKPKTPTADHVLPRSKSGSSRLENIATACPSCNHAKGANEKVVPLKMPHMPTYYELVRMAQTQPITIPHSSWVEYIGWDESLITVAEPIGLPGYMPLSTQ